MLGQLAEGLSTSIEILTNGQVAQNPKISGTITATNPTTIDIIISPHYSRVLFFLIFPILFIPVAILDEQIKINGVLREPKIYERILFVLIGGGIPIIWCYFDSIRPIKKAELWIKDRLGLQEITQEYRP